MEMEDSEPFTIKIEPDIGAILDNIHGGVDTCRVETSETKEKSAKMQDMRKRKKKVRETPKCKNFSIVVEKSAVNILKCCLCNKYYCSSSALESHIQKIHCTIKVNDPPLPVFKNVKNKPTKRRNTTQIASKKLKIYKKSRNATLLSDLKSINTSMATIKTNENSITLISTSCIKLATNIEINENSCSSQNSQIVVNPNTNTIDNSTVNIKTATIIEINDDSCSSQNSQIVVNPNTNTIDNSTVNMTTCIKTATNIEINDDSCSSQVPIKSSTDTIETNDNSCNVEDSNSQQNVNNTDEPEVSDIYDILVPKVEIEISETEFTAVIDDVNNTDTQNSVTVNVNDSRNSNNEDQEERLGYRCPFCNYSCEFKKQMQYHMRRSNVDNFEVKINDSLSIGTYYCQVCNTKFSTQAIYDFHIKTHSKSTCEICKYECFSECELMRHQCLKYHNLDRYQCYVCSDYFNTSVVLKEHFTRCHVNIDIKYRCQICTATFDTKGLMYKHSQLEFTYSNLDKDIFRPYKLNCNPCDKNNFTNNETSHIHIGNKVGHIYCCKSCKYKFSSVYYLNQHFMSQHMIDNEFDESSELPEMLIMNDETCDSIEIETPENENIIENVEMLIQTNHTGEPEIIVPDILDHEIFIPHEKTVDSKILTQVVNKTSNILKKTSKFKSIQLKVNNTISQVCSVDIQSNTSKSIQVNTSISKNYFEVNNSDKSDCNQKHSDDWCKLCKCSVGTNHAHSSSIVLNCQKCSFQSSSLRVLSKHFRKKHLPKSKTHMNHITLTDRTVDYAPKKIKQSRWQKYRKVKYYTTPATFANPDATDSLNMLNEINHCEVLPYFCCPLCLNTFDRYKSYTDHFTIHSILPIFKCIICEIQFDNCSCFNAHIKEHNETKIHCDSCCKDVNIDRYFSEHKCMTCVQCSLCSNEVANFTDLLTHTQDHIVSSPNAFIYKCKLCNFYFYTKYNLERHIVNLH